MESRQFVRDSIRRGLENGLSRRIFAVPTVADCLVRSRNCKSSIVIYSTIGIEDDAEIEEQLSLLSQASPRLSVIILGDHDAADRVLCALNRGAKGFIPSSTPLTVAVQAVELVAAGGCFVPASSLFASSPEVKPAQTTSQSLTNIFTARQAAVIEALRRGKANKIIAYELNMRESTVKVHVRNIMKKLNAKNRTEVAYRANELLASGRST
ncbi:MAG: response regulator transcription factor [Hyphomicrobiaceae bacterium]